MKVMGIQFDILWEDPDGNFDRCAPLIAQAAGQGARLVVLPEMFATGFSMQGRMADYAGDTVDFLSSYARKWNLWMLGGFAAPLGSKPGNAAALFDPSGKEVLRYHKIHPFTLAGEHLHFAAGERVKTAEVEGVRVTPLICYDLRFPEPFRIAAASTDLFVVMANWPDARIMAWKNLVTARAIENQCYVLGINRVGEGDGKRYSGDSMLVDPEGCTHASAAEQTALVGGDIDAGRVRTWRGRFSFLADRRPEQYQRLDSIQTKNNHQRTRGLSGS